MPPIPCSSHSFPSYIYVCLSLSLSLSFIACGDRCVAIQYWTLCIGWIMNCDAGLPRQMLTRRAVDAALLLVYASLTSFGPWPQYQSEFPFLFYSYSEHQSRISSKQQVSLYYRQSRLNKLTGMRSQRPHKVVLVCSHCLLCVHLSRTLWFCEMQT